MYLGSLVRSVGVVKSLPQKHNQLRAIQYQLQLIHGAVACAVNSHGALRRLSAHSGSLRPKRDTDEGGGVVAVWGEFFEIRYVEHLGVGVRRGEKG